MSFSFVDGIHCEPGKQLSGMCVCYFSVSCQFPMVPAPEGLPLCDPGVGGGCVGIWLADGAFS